jgi:hypothetical protein
LANIAVGLMLAVTPALGVVVIISGLDGPHQGALITDPDLLLHGLGNKPLFPDAGWIDSPDFPIAYRLRTQDPDTGLLNIEATLTDPIGVSWCWQYRGTDPSTTLANDDGLMSGRLAFPVDSGVGLNQPLVFESATLDRIFKSVETWKFVIQDYQNSPRLPPVGVW